MKRQPHRAKKEFQSFVQADFALPGILYPNPKVESVPQRAQVAECLYATAQVLNVGLPEEPEPREIPVIRDGYILRIEDQHTTAEQMAYFAQALDEVHTNLSRVGIELPAPIDVRINTNILNLQPGQKVPDMRTPTKPVAYDGVYVRNGRLDPGHIKLAEGSKGTAAHEIGHWLHHNMIRVPKGNDNKIKQMFHRNIRQNHQLDLLRQLVKNLDDDMLGTIRYDRFGPLSYNPVETDEWLSDSTNPDPPGRKRHNGNWMWDLVPSPYAVSSPGEWVAEMFAAVIIAPDKVPPEALKMLKKLGFISR